MLASVALMLATGAPGQGNLGFLKRAPIGSFNDQDRALMREATADVLNSSEPKASRAWKNAETGNSGTIESLARFETADGRECRTLHMQNRAKGGESGVLTTNVCRSDNGEWRADPGAEPADEAN